MMLEAMVTPSTMSKLLDDLSPKELQYVTRVEYNRNEPDCTLIGVECGVERALEVARSVQATIRKEVSLLIYDRLVVSEYASAGDYTLDNKISEICYWVNYKQSGFCDE